MRRFNLLVIVLGYPKTSAAASVTVAATLAQMTGWDWLVVFFLCLAGALASLVRRLEKESPSNWPLFLSGHFITAICAGFVLFAGGEHYSLPDFPEYIAVFFGSFGGAKTLDWAADNYRRVFPNSTLGAPSTHARKDDK